MTTVKQYVQREEEKRNISLCYFWSFRKSQLTSPTDNFKSPSHNTTRLFISSHKCSSKYLLILILQIDEAARKFQAVSDALSQLQVELEAQTQALEHQRKAEDQAQKDLRASTTAALQAKSAQEAAQKAEAEANIQLVNQKKSEELVRQAENALKEAVQALHNEEETYRNLLASLEKVQPPFKH